MPHCCYIASAEHDCLKPVMWQIWPHAKGREQENTHACNDHLHKLMPDDCGATVEYINDEGKGVETGS